MNKQMIGELLRKAREERGINQTQMAEMIGLKQTSKGQISAIENGKFDSLDFLERYADKVNVSLSDIFQLVGRAEESNNARIQKKTAKMGRPPLKCRQSLMAI